MTAERLQKVLAHAGVASRRAAEQMIADGRVRVNGLVVTELGTSVDALRDDIEVDGKPVAPEPVGHVYYAIYKPVGVVTTARDPQGRPTVMDMVDSDRRVYPVGRLDADSEGLLLMTDDGELTHRLTHASYEVEKEYQALVRCRPDTDMLKKLTKGVQLEDGLARAIRVGVLDRIHEGTWVRVVMHEGRKREVRRLLAAIECPVLALRRVRIGPLMLGEMEPGANRRLLPREVGELKYAVGLEGPPQTRATHVKRIRPRP